MAVKINTLEFENVKRIKAVQLAPSKNGLTIIGGKNGQGKTSVLDAICWALGGDKFKPSTPQREGSVIEPRLKITLDNGIVVERSGKNSALKVIDPNGNRGGQQLLNSFVETFALDLPKFLNQSPKEKANTLLKIIGVGDKVYEIEQKETIAYNNRHAIGQIADQKAKYCKEMPVFADVPTEIISASDLIAKQQDILKKNAENQRLRQEKARLERENSEIHTQLEAIQFELERMEGILKDNEEKLEIARRSAENLNDESTAELEKSIEEIDEINRKIRSNIDREKAFADAENFKNQYDELTQVLTNLRQEKTDLLNSADLPLDGLSVDKGELTFKGFKWDNMSSSEQLIVATSIVRKLNPECGFVLLDKLEQLDTDTLEDFGKWLENEGLQAIATRVSSGEECSIIIEDGTSFTNVLNPKSWKAGEF